MLLENDEVITLVDEDNNEHDFVVVDIIEVEGTEYAILLPNDEDTDEAVILKFDKDEDGNEILVEIDSDEEWEKVADAWEQLVVKDEDEEEQ